MAKSKSAYSEPGKLGKLLYDLYPGALIESVKFIPSKLQLIHQACLKLVSPSKELRKSIFSNLENWKSAPRNIVFSKTAPSITEYEKSANERSEFEKSILEEVLK